MAVTGGRNAMASSKAYLDYVLDQLSGLESVGVRAMMGEYVLYYRDKVVGGVYDDRLLLKPTPAAEALLPASVPEIPYPGAKAMLPADVDDRALLASLLPAMYDELPAPKRKKKRAPGEKG